jgi:hypothetical protein
LGWNITFPSFEQTEIFSGGGTSDRLGDPVGEVGAAPRPDLDALALL